MNFLISSSNISACNLLLFNKNESILVLKHYQAPQQCPIMGQVCPDSLDGSMGWQNLRKWENIKFGVQKVDKLLDTSLGTCNIPCGF